MIALGSSPLGRRTHRFRFDRRRDGDGGPGRPRVILIERSEIEQREPVNAGGLNRARRCHAEHPSSLRCRRCPQGTTRRHVCGYGTSDPAGGRPRRNHAEDLDAGAWHLMRDQGGRSDVRHIAQPLDELTLAICCRAVRGPIWKSRPASTSETARVVQRSGTTANSAEGGQPPQTRNFLQNRYFFGG